MSEAVAPHPETLADLIDSRPDLREILATNFNLAHAILLLRRGELEAVDRAVELAVRQGNSESIVVAECIRIELLRMAGDVPGALQRAETLARKERFNVMAALYFRHLFPLIEPDHRAEPFASSPAPGIAATDSVGAADSQSVHSVHSVAAFHEQAPAEPAEPAPELDLPSGWKVVGADPAMVYLRVRDASGTKEVRRAEIASGVMEDLAFELASRILERLSFGGLQHASFEGADRSIHTWRKTDRQASAIFQTGPSASLLAARCTRAFEEHAS